MAEKIKRCRKKNGLTQTELAEKIGISPMTIRRWEWGERNPDIALMPKLADALNTSIEYLMGLHEDTPPQDSNLREVHALHTPLTAEVTGKNIIIRDTNSHKEIEIPNNAEGHKLFIRLFYELFSGFGGQSVSNSINGDNNSNNKLGTINS